MSALPRFVDDPIKKAPADAGLLLRLSDLFSGAKTGHLGPDLYSNGGAAKFENILKGNGSYTPFAGEVQLLTEHAQYISDWAKSLGTAIIIGPGPAKSVMAKEIKVLKSMPNLKRVISLELSPAFNKQSELALSTALPNVSIHAFEIDFRTADLSGIVDSKPALVISTGSFTNYEGCLGHNFPHGQVTRHIAKMAELAGSGGKILWGYNSELNAAPYNQADVDDFLMYPLQKASMMEGVTLDASGFRHFTQADESASTLTHCWIANYDQDVVIGDETYPINKGEQFSMFFSVAQSPDRLERFMSNNSKTSSSFFEKGSSGAVIHGFDCK